MFPLSDSIPAKSFPLVNLSIIALTVFVFIQQISAADPEAFTSQYALVPSLVDFSNYQTLAPFVSAIFLHGGFLHIISNMWFLWVFGDNVEGHFGKLFYPLFYLICGVLGNLMQYFLASQSHVVMLGASGAVAGVLGAYYVLFPQAKIKTLIPIFVFLTVLDIPATFMLGYWFILQILSGAASIPLLSSQTGGIAFWAHIGGFLTGVFFATTSKNEE